MCHFFTNCSSSSAILRLYFARHLHICVQHIDNEYKTRGESITQRASDLWTRFNNRMNQFNPPWTALEIQTLSDYCFVPISRFVSDLRSYRDDLRVKSNKSLITMKDVMETRNVPLLWTQKHGSESPPALELKNVFSFAPTVLDVVKHLVGGWVLSGPNQNVRLAQ